MELEAMLLGLGPSSMGQIQRAFTFDALIGAAPANAAWFLEFVGSRDTNWLTRVDLLVLERFWRILRDARMRRMTVEVIAKVECNTRSEEAFLSLIPSLFREDQSQTSGGSLRPDGALIFDVLMTRIKMTPPGTLNARATRLGNYCLRVLKYCFRNRFQKLTPADLRAILDLAGDVPEDISDRLRSMALIE
jgi:hypothetical protein